MCPQTAGNCEVKGGWAARKPAGQENIGWTPGRGVAAFRGRDKLRGRPKSETAITRIRNLRAQLKENTKPSVGSSSQDNHVNTSAENT